MKNERVSTELPAVGFVRLQAILKIYPVSKSTWWKGVKEGRFPASVKLGDNTTAWRVEDIRALIDAARPPGRADGREDGRKK